MSNHPQSSSPPLLSNNPINDVNANMAPKGGGGGCQLPSVLGSPQTGGRKLTRSDSTFGEDIFDESLAELSLLNQRHLLRQQWYRKNNMISGRLRRSTSTASNSSSSSSSSSGISSSASGVYSSCSANTSSFASSFSSSFATLSSLSESCDTGECGTGSQPLSETDPYPRILRKSSFKNKYNNTCPYKPYYKPRRSSLQLFKAGPAELPDNFKFYPPKATYLFGGQQQGPASVNGRFLVNSADGATKSNPASPNKQQQQGSLRGGDGGGMETMTERDDEVPSSMQAAQIVITSSGNAVGGGVGGSGPSQQSAAGPVGGGQPVLVRSKSLDDLNSLLYYSNTVYPASPTPSDASGSGGGGGGVCGNNVLVHPSSGALFGQQGSYGGVGGGGIGAPHYSSFNRIFSDYSKVDPFNPGGGGGGGGVNCTTPPQLFNSLFNSGPCSHPAISSATSSSLYPPEASGQLGVSNFKGFSYSSHEICNAGATGAVGQQQQQQQPLLPPLGSQPNSLNNANNSSLCDIDHVLKKISSLRV